MVCFYYIFDFIYNFIITTITNNSQKIIIIEIYWMINNNFMMHKTMKFFNFCGNDSGSFRNFSILLNLLITLS